MENSSKKNWLLSVSNENWKIVKDDNVWAFRSAKIVGKISKGDRLIFFVVRSQPPSFMGIYEIIGDFRQSLKPRWSDEIESNKIIYLWEVDINQIILGTVNVRKNFQKFSFIEKSKWPAYLQGTPANFKRPVPEEDYRLIYELMKQPTYDVTFKPKAKPRVIPPITPPIKPPITPPIPIQEMPSHKEMQEMLLSLGKFEEYYVDKEIPLDGERLDVTWKQRIRRQPDLAFEVHKSGNIYSAMVKLKEAWDLWGCKAVLVTTEEHEEAAKRWFRQAFHEMEKDSRVIRWEKISQWLALMKERKKIKDELRI